MAAGKHGSAEVTIAYDDAPGGTLRTITSFVLQMGAVKISSAMQANTPYGATVEGMLPTGVSKIDQITIHGYWDDTALTGPHTVFLSPDTSPQSATRTLQIVFGNARTWTSEGFLVSYAVLGKAGNLTEFEAVLQQNSGAWS
jgi:hypothetical protein